MLHPGAPEPSHQGKPAIGGGNTERRRASTRYSFTSAEPDKIGPDDADGQGNPVPGSDASDQGADHASCRSSLSATHTCCIATAAAIAVTRAQVGGEIMPLRCHNRPTVTNEIPAHVAQKARHEAGIGRVRRCVCAMRSYACARSALAYR